MTDRGAKLVAQERHTNRAPNSVETGADSRRLSLRDPQPERLDRLFDLARRHAGHIRLLHNRDERLLAAPGAR
jgi:hypothetical protein